MTAPYVLDADTVTHQQAGRASVLRRLSAVSPDGVFTTVITVREQLIGRLAAVDQTTEGPDLLLAYDRLLATVRYFAHVNVLPFSPTAMATLRGLRDQRIRIGTQDLRIAAIVLAAEAPYSCTTRWLIHLSVNPAQFDPDHRDGSQSAIGTGVPRLMARLSRALSGSTPEFEMVGEELRVRIWARPFP